MFVSRFVIQHGAVPLNPFMIFDYFLLDSVERDAVRDGNNTLVRRCDELWVFGQISDGVLVEINLATSLNKPVRFFDFTKDQVITEVLRSDLQLEAEAAVK
ncbi:MAG: hypothetical protein U0517_01355 [Candidatus Andersenbacteria bacterium]